MYEPLERPVIVCVVSPLLHSYEYGAVPPVGNAWANPSEKPKQDALIGLIETFWSGYISIEYKDIAAFTTLVVVLIFFPTGFLGKPDIEKV